jgi:hypothetical protein
MAGLFRPIADTSWVLGFDAGCGHGFAALVKSGIIRHIEPAEFGKIP